MSDRLGLHKANSIEATTRKMKKPFPGSKIRLGSAHSSSDRSSRSATSRQSKKGKDSEASVPAL